MEEDAAAPSFRGTQPACVLRHGVASRRRKTVLPGRTYPQRGDCRDRCTPRPASGICALHRDPCSCVGSGQPGSPYQRVLHRDAEPAQDDLRSGSDAGGLRSARRPWRTLPMESLPVCAGPVRDRARRRRGPCLTGQGTPCDFAPLLERCFLFDAVEASYELSGIVGRVPGWLRGTYYVNGPARFKRPGRTCRNWLDGDGMVYALRFGSQGIHFTSRFVQTPKLLGEEAAGRFLYRGFGTAFPGDRLRRKVMLEPPVNVSVYPYNGKLLAFGEQTLPYELDPVTLETSGEYDFKGSLNEVSPFSAHAKFDGHLLNFGVAFSAAKPMLNVYEFDGTGALLSRKRYAIGNPHSVHDFGFT